ncbi:MAG: methyltransferase domain-containing protein [Candidatus Parcubacteria bacterium]|nr:methyltransferase domain-containing protein [Candidatus Parcubacteria bacterium]
MNHNINKFKDRGYDSENRWISYWHQINEVIDLNPENVLEVGIGNKTASNYLKNLGIEVTTLDADEELGPDIVSDVLEIPLKDDSFDVVLCAEVLEHLDFEKFEPALKELKRVAKKYLILSLPHFGPAVKLSFKFPFIREKKFAFKLFLPLDHKFNGDHYWEIGKRGYPESRIKKIITDNFKIRKDFIPFENQYHHFFILEKI